MKKLTTVLILLINSLAFSQTTTGSEPKQTFEMTINGKNYQVTEGEELKLNEDLSKPTITIKLSGYKNFNDAAMSFKYPKHLSYEFSQDFGYKNWTLSGNNLTVLIFELDAKTELEQLVDEMVKKFEKKNCTITDFQKELGGKKCKGKKINVILAGQKIVMECYEIKSNDFKSRFIYFQDSMGNNTSSEEFIKGFNMIDSTLKYF